MQSKHVLIVDDHTLFRTGMKMILMQLGEAAKISEANSIKDAFEFSKSNVDIILLDINLPGVSGFDGIKPLSDKFGAVPIVILSANTETSCALRAKKLGASGFIHKASHAEDMVASIDKVLNGGTCFSELTDDMPLDSSGAAQKSLTPRQVEVLTYLCEGKPNKLIARELAMSENTVRVHVSAILSTLGASNRTEAILIAQRHDITT